MVYIIEGDLYTLKGFMKSYAKVRLFLSTLPLFQNNKITWIVKDQW